jgi:hypothetical protein
VRCASEQLRDHAVDLTAHLSGYARAHDVLTKPGSDFLAADTLGHDHIGHIPKNARVARRD